MISTVQNRNSLPEAKVFVYRLNNETGYYEKQSGEPEFQKLPFELKVEETRKPEQIHSKVICRGRTKNGRYIFFTGLIPVSGGGLFFGDHYEFVEDIKKNSFILFAFTQGNEVLTIHFFNHFKVYPSKRAKFISTYLNK